MHCLSGQPKLHTNATNMRKLDVVAQPARLETVTTQAQQGPLRHPVLSHTWGRGRLPARARLAPRPHRNPLGGGMGAPAPKGPIWAPRVPPQPSSSQAASSQRGGAGDLGMDCSATAWWPWAAVSTVVAAAGPQGGQPDQGTRGPRVAGLGPKPPPSAAQSKHPPAGGQHMPPEPRVAMVAAATTQAGAGGLRHRARPRVLGATGQTHSRHSCLSHCQQNIFSSLS